MEVPDTCLKCGSGFPWYNKTDNDLYEKAHCKKCGFVISDTSQLEIIPVTSRKTATYKTSAARLLFGEVVKEHRNKLGLTQKQFGKEIGCSYQHVNNCEHGKVNVGDVYLKRAAEFIGVEYSHYFNKEDIEDEQV